MQMSQLSTSVCEERGLWDVTSSDLFNANLPWHRAPYRSAITGCLCSVFTIIRQTFRILSQIITAICPCWGLDRVLMHIWIWWHSLDGETCLISFQHATYLPQGRERYPISTDQYFQHADVCTSLIRTKSLWSTELQNHSIQRPFNAGRMSSLFHLFVFCWKHFHWYVSSLTYGDVYVTLTARTQQLVILGTLFHHLYSIFLH